MGKQIVVNIGRGLYNKLLCRLAEIDRSTKGLPKEGFLPYSYVYEGLCRNFSIKKEELRELIFLLRDTGFIEISPIGIKLKYRMQNE